MNLTAAAQDVQLFDADEVRRALELLLPSGQVTEVRALDAVTYVDRWPHTASGYFNDPDKLLAALESVRAAKAVYLIPNPVNPALLARAANRVRKAGKGDTTSDGDIVSRRWLLVDCDPRARPVSRQPMPSTTRRLNAAGKFGASCITTTAGQNRSARIVATARTYSIASIFQLTTPDSFNAVSWRSPHNSMMTR